MRSSFGSRTEDRGSTARPSSRAFGGRLALAARVDLGDRPVVVCSVHLESESDPGLRAEQIGVVLDAVDQHYGPIATVVGGDLNTFSASLHEARANFRSWRDKDATRFCWPVPYEPLFEVAASHGFEVDGANTAEQTWRLAPDQRPGSLLRLDWLLVRDLEVVGCSTIPAIDPQNEVISDHDGVSVTLRHPT